MTRMGLLQNLDELREADERRRRSGLGTLVLTSLGASCVIFALLAQAHRRAPAAGRPRDALAELLAETKGGAVASTTVELGAQEVTFPSLLSDEPRTTTALAAVRPGPQLPADSDSAMPGKRAGNAAVPPPATDRLPVVPLPAKDLVALSRLVERPRDVLAELAKRAGAPPAPAVEPGRAGGYQLQVSSFRNEPEAASFALALRQRGHRAYTEVAQVTGRGTWYRVRVGPFNGKRDAVLYRAVFEEREHLVPFVVDPPGDKLP